MLKGRDVHPCFFQAGCGYDNAESVKERGRRPTDDSSLSKDTRETSKEDLSRSVYNAHLYAVRSKDYIVFSYKTSNDNIVHSKSSCTYEMGNS